MKMTKAAAIAAALLALPLPVFGQSTDLPPAIYTDPPADKAHPAAMEVVHIPSGGAIHGTDDVDVPIREQPGVRTLVRIGEGTWIGGAAVVMADVGRHCVIGAGSVVTKPIPDYSVAAGVPARVIRLRRAGGPDEGP